MPDIEAIIGTAMSGLDSDSGTESTETTETTETVDTPEAATEPATETPETPEVTEGVTDTPETEAAKRAAAVEDAFAKEHGIDPQDQRRRENRIPYSQVKKITANAERKLYEGLTGEKLAEGAPIGEAITKFSTLFKESTAKNSDYESRLASVQQVESIMENDPDRFLTMLPSINPKYAELLKRDTPAERERLAAADKLPEPDYDLGEGKRTYTPEGLVKLVKAVAAQARDEALAETDKKYGRIGARYEADQRIESATANFRQHVANAEKNWEGFKENAPKVYEQLRLDTTGKLTLHDAYIRTMNTVHKEALAAAKVDEAKLREKWVKELKAKPANTSAGSSAGVAKVVDPNKPRDPEDIIREAMAKLK